MAARADLLLTLWPCDTPNSRDATDDPILEEFAASVRSLGAALAAARLEDEPPAEVAHTCGLPGRQQMPPQYVDSVLQTPPPRPTLRVADSPTGSSLQEHMHGGAASGHDEGCPPGFGPAGPTVNVVPPSTPLVDAFADRLELFVNKVTSKIASPLIREPPKQLPVKVVLPPRRSKRQAAQSLSRVPALSEARS